MADLKNVKEKIVNIKDKVVAKLKKSKKLKKGLMATGIFVASLVIVIVVSIVVMRATGKSSLYEKNSEGNIDFEQTDTDQELEIDMEDESTSEQNVADNESSETTETSNVSDESTENSGDSEQATTTATTANDEEIEDDEEPTGGIIQGSDEDDYDIIYNGKKYVYNEDILTLLILGVDKDSKVEPAEDGISGGQSDGIYMIVMNPDTKKIDLITVHRDTIARLWIYDRDGSFVQTARAQICLQHGYGDGMELSNERAKKAISTMFYGLPIHSVTSVNMGAIPELNDAIGGVTLEALESFSRNGYTFEQGETYNLKGMAAYAYVRFRDTSHHYTASKRLERQKQYLSKAIEQGMDAIMSDVTIVADIYDIIKDYVVTDLSVDEMVYLATEAADYSFGQIYTPAGTVDTSRRYERYYLDEDAFQEMIVKIFYEEIK